MWVELSSRMNQESDTGNVRTDHMFDRSPLQHKARRSVLAPVVLRYGHSAAYCTSLVSHSRNELRDCRRQVAREQGNFELPREAP